LQVAAARRDRDGVAPDGKLAGLLRAGAMGVAEIVELRDEVLLGDRLAAAQFDRARVDARQRALALAVQARVDEAREGDVVVGERGAGEQRDRGEHVKQVTSPAALVAQATALAAAGGWFGGGVRPAARRLQIVITQ
jgi:hypothetical protein